MVLAWRCHYNETNNTNWRDWHLIFAGDYTGAYYMYGGKTETPYVGLFFQAIDQVYETNNLWGSLTLSLLRELRRLFLPHRQLLAG